MNRQHDDMLADMLVKAVIVFAALAIGGVVMAVIPLAVASLPANVQGLLIGLGSALFGAGLAFILIEIFAFERERAARGILPARMTQRVDPGTDSGTDSGTRASPAEPTQGPRRA